MNSLRDCSNYCLRTDKMDSSLAYVHVTPAQKQEFLHKNETFKQVFCKLVTWVFPIKMTSHCCPLMSSLQEDACPAFSLSMLVEVEQTR